MSTQAFELAREYYRNGAWTVEYLNALVKAGKLTDEEYQEITGVAYENTEVIG